MQDPKKYIELLARKLLPEINFTYAKSLSGRFLRRTSVIKSVFYSVRSRGVVIVGRRAHIVMKKHARIVFSKKAIFIVGILENLPEHTLIELADRATLYVDGVVGVNHGSSIVLGSDAIMRIGDHTFINERCNIRCRQHMLIGRNCAISWAVTIIDSDVHQIFRSGSPQQVHKDVLIGDRVWIGTNATILKGVKIGNGAIIGAGSVVTSNVPADSISAGSPASVKASDVTWLL